MTRKCTKSLQQRLASPLTTWSAACKICLMLTTPTRAPPGCCKTLGTRRQPSGGPLLPWLSERPTTCLLSSATRYILQACMLHMLCALVRGVCTRLLFMLLLLTSACLTQHQHFVHIATVDFHLSVTTSRSICKLLRCLLEPHGTLTC